MATWSEIRGYINSNFQVDNDEGNLLTLTFGSATGNRSQIIFVSYLDLDDPVVVFQSPFAATSQISAAQVLDAAMGIPFGVSSTGDYYTVTHIQFAATVDGPEIDLPLAYVTGAADGMQEALGLPDLF